MAINNIERALKIERLDAVQDGVYVCVSAAAKEYKILPLDKVYVEVNGTKQLLGELLNSLVTNYNKLIDYLIDKNNKEVG